MKSEYGIIQGCASWMRSWQRELTPNKWRRQIKANIRAESYTGKV